MSNYGDTDIAIIGLAGQFPGADNIEKYWNNIRDGVESVSFFSEEELLNEGISKDLISSKSYVKANAYLENKHCFDAAFFGYTSEEARLMDPQLRLFHQNCWHALEDAGYSDKNVQSTIGLFAGGAVNLNWMNYAHLSNSNNDIGYSISMLGSDVAFLCSSVSYALNLQGPVVCLNTACSTSLVAVQKASMSLLLRECDLALAGGVRINNFSKRGYLHKEGTPDSRDGHCRPS
ncbi:MAG: hypothetical protein C0490_11625, partial [Marivirga sp.]|nr:hypothetical protein [Marivirga sp.]